EQLETIQQGVADLGLTLPAYTPGKLPLAYTNYAYPFAPEDPVVATEIWWQLMSEFPIFDQEMADNNVKLLYVASADDYALVSRMPMENLDDFNGKKVVQLGGYFADWTKAAGITPVSGVTVAERYERLRTGVVDGDLLPPSLMKIYGTYEVAKHLIMVKTGARIPLSYIINLDVWNKFTPELQELFLEVGHETQLRHAAATRAESLKAIEFMQNEGKVKFYGDLNEQDVAKWAALVPDTPAMMCESLQDKYPEIWDVADRYLQLAEDAGHQWPKQFAVR
ncbi:TRAP transporter substrate-binding protein DctP, partial [Chloroflexota bacterium]